MKICMSPDFGANAIIRHALPRTTGFGNQVFVETSRPTGSYWQRRQVGGPRPKKYVRDLVSGVCVVDSTVSVRQQKNDKFLKDVVLLEKRKKTHFIT